jgi:transcriptional regulator with XRE-family HTH domain
MGGLYMILTDRKRLAKLMLIQEVTQRELSTAAGWTSHSYLQRLLDGKVNTLKPEAALKIANYLGVGIDDLFVVRVSTNTGRTDQQKVPA